MNRFAQGLALACLVGVGLVGCGPARPPPGGDLVVDWTIAGDTRWTDCELTQTATVRLEVLDERGAVVNAGADTQDCSAFGTSFNGSFFPGDYLVEVTMLHADGTPSSTTARAPARVFSAETTYVPFDFSPNSFF